MEDNHLDIDPEAVLYLRNLLRCLRRQEENDRAIETRRQEIQSMVVTVNPYFNGGHLSDDEPEGANENDTDDKHLFGAQPLNILPHYFQNCPNFDNDDFAEDMPVFIQPVDVPLREICHQDPLYAWLQNVVESMQNRISQGGVHPDVAEAKNITLDDSDDEELQGLLDEEIARVEEKERKWLESVYCKIVWEMRQGEQDYDHQSHANSDDGIDNSETMLDHIMINDTEYFWEVEMKN